MNLHTDEAEKIVFEEHESWVKVAGTEERIAEGKGYIACTAVFRDIESDKYYRIDWDELDDEWGCHPFEFQDPVAIEVQLVNKIICAWEKV